MDHQYGSIPNSTLNVGSIAVVYSGPSCISQGEFHISGGLTGGSWNSGNHALTYSSAPGLKLTETGQPYTVVASWKNTSGILTLL